MPGNLNDVAVDIPAFSCSRAMSMYQAGHATDLSEYFLDFLEGSKNRVWRKLSPGHGQRIADFLKTFLYIFTQEDYVVSDVHGVRFINCNPVIANLAAMSPFRTTDPWLEVLRPQTANFVKILTLLNARCSAKFSVDSLFSTNPDWASYWFVNYFMLFFGGTPTRLMWENGVKQVEYGAPHLKYIGPLTGDLYFFPSYFAVEQESKLKRVFHSLAAPIMGRTVMKSRPNRKSIAIVSGRWNRTTAVFTSLAPLVGSLRGEYDLTLVRLGNRGADQDIAHPEWFGKIRNVAIEDLTFSLSEILENDFGLAYFPDIGMRVEDRHLCNLRMAPIQVMGYGHPVSTHEAEIDYFIGGQEVELLEDAEKNYSERLVTIPGLGVIPVFPESPRVTAQHLPSSEPFIINCPWAAHKCTFTHLQTLRRLADESTKPVRFRFFAGPGLINHNQYISFCDELEREIGCNRVEVVDLRPYAEYQRLMSEGMFALDSFPFGGFNSVIDSLWLGKPVVVLEGVRAFNRFGAATLRRIGLPELVAATPEEYIAIAARLINDQSWLADLSRRVMASDLEASLVRSNEIGAFKRAIDFIISNHAKLKSDGSRKPIHIG